MAGQRLCLYPSSLSQWSYYTISCPSWRAGDHQRVHLHADEASQLYPIARTNHRVILPVDWNWGQVLNLTFRPPGENRTNPFLKGDESRWPGISQEGEPDHCHVLAHSPCATWPVLWICSPDCSCDPLTCPPGFHPGQRDLPLRKGAVLSWQGRRGARQFAPHLAVQALCDRCHRQAWATEPSGTTGGGRGLQSHWLWGKVTGFYLHAVMLPLQTNCLDLPVQTLIWRWTELLPCHGFSPCLYTCNTHHSFKVLFTLIFCKQADKQCSTSQAQHHWARLCCFQLKILSEPILRETLMQ